MVFYIQFTCFWVVTQFELASFQTERMMMLSMSFNNFTPNLDFTRFAPKRLLQSVQIEKFVNTQKTESIVLLIIANQSKWIHLPHSLIYELWLLPIRVNFILRWANVKWCKRSYYESEREKKIEIIICLFPFVLFGVGLMCPVLTEWRFCSSFGWFYERRIRLQ